MPSQRTRSFRRSVVQVVAAFSPVVAAGGCDLFSVTETTHNPPPCEVYPEECEPDPPKCPEELPEAEAACEDLGEVCIYDTGRARCVDDKWHVVGKCPEQPVKIWDECSLPEGTLCAADDECNPLVACSEGRWGGDGKLLICNPPEPECPLEAPEDQSDCQYAGPACAYPEGRSAECKDEKWQLTQPCPEALPTAGDACLPTPEVCGYQDCYGLPVFTAECVERVWAITEMSCNPPPATE